LGFLLFFPAPFPLPHSFFFTLLARLIGINSPSLMFSLNLFPLLDLTTLVFTFAFALALGKDRISLSSLFDNYNQN